MTHNIQNQIQHIAILGGGTAGWMSAAALASIKNNSNFRVTLIESDDIGTIGVGEATIPQMEQFNKALGIKEQDFMRATQATFKLGIEFANWSKKGESYIHPFSTYGYEFEDLPFHQYWQRAFQSGFANDISAYSLNVQASLKNRFVHAQNIKNSPLANITYAYHLDAGLYAKFLREYAEQRGISRIEGKVEVIHSDKSGCIESLELENGERIEADFFIDCSGFKSLLLGEELNVEFDDWSHLLPANSAITAQTEPLNDTPPYTRSTALSAGWQWRIPLQHRTGNGYVYSTDFISDEEAEQEFKENLEGKLINKPRIVRFKTGVRKKIWHKNCLAVGLSGGFLEPLESTSIYLIQATLSRFFALFPTKKIETTLENKLNEQMLNIYYPTRDFIIAHYHVNQRDDAEFWRHCQTMEVPDSVKDKLALYQDTARIYRENNELFNETSWLAVLHGQGARATSYNPLTERLDKESLEKKLSDIEAVIEKCAARMPTHNQYIAKYCPSPKSLLST